MKIFSRLRYTWYRKQHSLLEIIGNPYRDGFMEAWATVHFVYMAGNTVLKYEIRSLKAELASALMQSTWENRQLIEIFWMCTTWPVVWQFKAGHLQEWFMQMEESERDRCDSHQSLAAGSGRYLTRNGDFGGHNSTHINPDVDTNDARAQSHLNSVRQSN